MWIAPAGNARLAITAVNLIALGFIVLAMAQTVLSWSADLVEGRRSLRVFIVVTAALYGGLDAILQMLALRGDAAAVANVASSAMLACIVVVIASAMMQVTAGGLFPAASEAPVSAPHAVADAGDQKLIDALMRLMADERIYRHDNVTIGTLATRLSIPEYRLRRLINQRLGYRNFNVFLNERRIAEAKAALADPTQAEVPVITIAMDAGFQSLGPFNRAFKATTGVTPSEYRRLRGSRRERSNLLNHVVFSKSARRFKLSTRPISKSGERSCAVRPGTRRADAQLEKTHDPTTTHPVLTPTIRSARSARPPCMRATCRGSRPALSPKSVLGNLRVRTGSGQAFSETMAAMPGTGLISWALDYKVDRTRKDVTVTLLGVAAAMRSIAKDWAASSIMAARSRTRRCRPTEARLRPALLPDIAGPSPVAPAMPQLAAAIDRAFAEPDAPPFRHTRAVVVVRDGRIVAERYAEGFGIDTPMIGFSATKSVTSALVGILVRQGKLALDRPAPVAAWRDPAIRGMRSPSTSCCAIPRALRSAVRCRPRSARRWSR